MHDIDFKHLPPAGDSHASRERFRYCASRGVLQHVIPKEYGGLADQFEDLIKTHTLLGLSSVDSGLTLSINAHLWGAVFPLLRFGNNTQKQHWLTKMLTGEIIAGHAITEPQAGSDINALQTQVRIEHDGFILNGCKRFVTNTPIADFLVVYARIEEKLSAFIVNRSDPGADFMDTPRVSSCANATMGDVVLKNCRLPASRQLGKTGAGNLMIQQALELERAFIFAGFSGIMQWQLNKVLQFSRERKTNNVHLGKHQAVSHKIAAMKLRLDTVRLWVGKCAHLKDNKQRITLASAQTKLYAAEAFLQSSLDAVHILGAGGLLEDSEMSRLVYDALGARLFSGSSEIQSNIIAALLGTGDGYKPT